MTQLPLDLAQSELQARFVSTSNTGEVKSPVSPKGDGDLPPTKKQLKVQARVLEYIKEHGGIDALTAQGLGTTDARKIFTRLRDKGFLFPADDPRGHEDRPNHSGQGTYRWHRWTGKQ